MNLKPITDMLKITNRTYRRTGFFHPAIFILGLALITAFQACKKDKDSVAPSVTIKTGNDYTPDRSVIAVGRAIKIGITAKAGDANITNLVVKKIMPDGGVKEVFDTGMNSTGFTINKIFYQSIEDTAQWTIQIMDKNRLFATAAITIFKDVNSTWGGIYEYPHIIMGYQGNAAFGHYLVPSTGQVWFADTARLNQPLIDIVPYFFVSDDKPSPTLSSPGEQGGGINEYYPELAQWTTLRYTKWDVSVDGDPIPVADFEACHNDSLLILSYDDVWGKKKYKWADPGEVIPFMTASGKKGLLKIISADQDPAGKIEFSLKIQQ